MSKALLSIMRRESERVLAQRSTTRLGLVTSYDPKTYTCKVALQPDGPETGWIPVTTVWVGNQWGLFCPPSPGDQVEVEFQEGSVENGLVTGRLFSAEDKPLEVESGEFWLVHKSGSYLKFLNDGNVELHVEGTLVSDAASWEHTGDVHIDGNLDVSENVNDMNGTMQEMRTKYNSHTGHSTGGPPSPQMD